MPGAALSGNDKKERRGSLYFCSSCVQAFAAYLEDKQRNWPTSEMIYSRLRTKMRNAGYDTSKVDVSVAVSSPSIKFAKFERRR